jgi:hypothetical protein
MSHWCTLIWTFITHLLVHIRQKKKIAAEIASVNGSLRPIQTGRDLATRRESRPVLAWYLVSQTWSILLAWDWCKISSRQLAYCGNETLARKMKDISPRPPQVQCSPTYKVCSIYHTPVIIFECDSSTVEIEHSKSNSPLLDKESRWLCLLRAGRSASGFTLKISGE